MVLTRGKDLNIMNHSEQTLQIHVVTSTDGSRISVTNFEGQRRKVYGLDCEWDIEQQKRASTPKPDVLQIATPDGYCVLFKLNQMKEFPKRLKEFLENPDYLKVGVGVAEDILKLQAGFGVEAQSALDVRYCADEVGVDPRGLSTLSETVLGVRCKKYHHTDAIHCWSGFLTNEQKRYAAIDAVNGVKIFHALNERRLSRDHGDHWTSWSEEECDQESLDHWRRYFGRYFDYSRSKYYIDKIVETMLSMSCLSVDPQEMRDVEQDQSEDG